MNSETSFTFDQVKYFIHRGEKVLAKLEVDYCCPKMILPALMGVRKKKFFSFTVCILFCGACTTELCLSATSDVKEYVRYFAVFHIYKY